MSTEAIYQFNVSANRTLVAHFALGNLIRVSAEPANAGTASGGGVYLGGASVTVEASANPGYLFLNWTENGETVSTSPAYSFISDTNHTLAANFIAHPALATTLTGPGVLTLSWPAGANGWVLQESPDLSLGSWVDSIRSVTIVGSQKQVTVSPRPDSRYFRLARP